MRWRLVMANALVVYTALVHAVIEVLLRAALALDRHERWAVRTAKRLRGSLLRLWRRWTGTRLQSYRGRSSRGRTAWNRTPPETELAVLRMHHDHRELGSLRPRALLRRTLGIRLAKETVRKILRRGPPTAVEWAVHNGRVGSTSRERSSLCPRVEQCKDRPEVLSYSLSRNSQREPLRTRNPEKPSKATE